MIFTISIFFLTPLPFGILFYVQSFLSVASLLSYFAVWPSEMEIPDRVSCHSVFENVSKTFAIRIGWSGRCKRYGRWEWSGIISWL